MVRYISFDLDGTLANNDFDYMVWNEEIPRLYARIHKVPYEDARTRVFAEYYKVMHIEKPVRMSDISYWFERLKLGDYKELVQDMKRNNFVYEDTKDTLKYLHDKGYKLIVVSNADDKFLKAKTEAEGISEFFEHRFSAPTSFGHAKKNRDVFEKVLATIGVAPHEMVHVGDEHHYDVEVPGTLGISGYFLVRGNKPAPNDANVIRSLRELMTKF